jgi:superfamily II DNA/RNA helicase
MTNNSYARAGRRRRTVFSSKKLKPHQRRNASGGRYIDPQKFVNEAKTPQAEEVFVPKHQFAELALMEQLKRTLEQRGYTTPTPVQDGAIPPAIEGRDVIGLANTGTGKTAAFVLPIIQRLQKELHGSTALIIAPTRELAVQINDEFKLFAEGLKIYSAICVGGTNIKPQIRQLERRPQVVIGTPGRLKDLYNQGILQLKNTGIVVLDEADRMLDMGFIRDIRFLLDKLPDKKQTLCFSATITAEIQRLLDDMMVDPVTISVRRSETSEHVQQDIIKAHTKQEKIQILQDLLNKPEFAKTLVFGQTKWSVQRLAEQLTKSGIKSEAIHGNKSQAQRQRALDAFKSGKVSVLVATDVAARGLDIPEVSHVINFDQPATYEDYIHRIGRTGRAGHRGHALTFV